MNNMRQEMPFFPFILRMFGQVCCVSFSFDVQHQVRRKSSFFSVEMVFPGDEDPSQQHQGNEQDGNATK